MNDDKLDIDLNVLKIFIEVYRANSITLAAESLGMTQPGVSGAMKRLQTQVGAELFIRKGRSIAPTQKGIQFAQHIEQSLQGVNDAILALGQFDIHRHHTFRLSLSEVMQTILQPKIEADQELGNVKFEIVATPFDEEELEQDLTRQNIDLALDIYEPTSTAFSTKLSYQDQLVVACRQHHPRIGNSISEAQFFSEQHIAIKLRRQRAFLAQKYAKRRIKERAIASECDSLLNALFIASRTDNICSTSRLLSQHTQSLLGIKTLEYPMESLPIEYFFIWHKRNETNPAHIWLRQRFEHYINETVQEHQQ